MVAARPLTELQYAALDYRERGLSVIPIDPFEGDGKKAGVCWRGGWKHAAAKEFTDFFRPPVRQLAICLGPASRNLVARDFDVPGAYDAWKSKHPDEAATLPTVRTGRVGGYHVYGVCENARSRDCDDGEFRAVGNYTVAPPSNHASGNRYAWTIELPDVLPLMPPSLIPEATAPERPRLPREDRPKPPAAGEYSLCEIPAGDVSELIAKAVAATVVYDAGERNAKRFEFVRRLRAFLPYETSPQYLRPIFDEWYRRSAPAMRRKNYRAELADFYRNWKSVTWPYGATLRGAMHEATASLPDGADPMMRLTALCASLQRVWGDKPFFLASRTAGDFMGVSNFTANDRIKTLVKLGVLTVETPAVQGAKGRAAYFWYEPLRKHI